MMDNWKAYGGFTVLGTIAWNGGPITEKEIMTSAKKGWPTILVKGSGRSTDELASKFLTRDSDFLSKLPSNHRLSVVQDPESLNSTLCDSGFIN